MMMFQQGGGSVVPVGDVLQGGVLNSTVVQRWRKGVKSGYMQFRKSARERLAWCTVLAAATSLSLEQESVSWSAQAVHDLKVRWRGAVKRKLPGLRWRGVIEFDLLHPDLLRGSTHKQRLLADLGVDVAGLAGHHRVLLPHLHAVVSLEGYPQERVAEELRVPFGGRWGVLLRPLWVSGTVGEHLTNLAGYSSKMRFQYSEFHPDKATKFNVPFEPEWKDLVVRVIEYVGLDGLCFRSSR